MTIIENFIVATTVAFPKDKEKLTDNQTNLEYLKTKLTEALFHYMVCIMCMRNKIKFYYTHNSGYLRSSINDNKYVICESAFKSALSIS